MDQRDEILQANNNLMDKRQILQASKPKPISETIELTLSGSYSDSADDRANEFTWVCDDCERTVTPFTWTLGRRTRYIQRKFCDCPSGQAKEAAYQEVVNYDEWTRQSTAIITQSGLDTKQYQRFQFNTWDKRLNAPWSGQVLDDVECYVNQVTALGGNWLYLYGDYGLGKTHLAIATLRKIAAIRLWKPHVVVWPELCQETQESWGSDNGATEAKLWGQARQTKILLIDDLDKTTTGEWAMGKLFGLINRRAMEGKPTIITANHSVTNLQTKWARSKKPHVNDTGMAVLSRIVGELWGLISFQGDDQRMA